MKKEIWNKREKWKTGTKKILITTWIIENIYKINFKVFQGKNISLAKVLKVNIASIFWLIYFSVFLKFISFV